MKYYLNKATAEKPGVAVWLKKALTLYQQGKIAEAERFFKRILKESPDNRVALYSYGLLLINSKRSAEALKIVTHGTEKNSDFPMLWFLRGVIHKQFNQLESAILCYDNAISIDEEYISALINKGAILREMHRHLDAQKCFHKILTIDPDHPIALNNYGALLTEGKESRITEAIETFSRLLKIMPDYHYGKGILAYTKLHVCDWSTLEVDTTEVTNGIREGKRVCRSLGYMALSDSAEDHFKCAKIYAENEFPNRDMATYQGEIYKHDRLRIAYISPDFREHPVGHLMAGVIENHDRSKFEIICVSIGIDDKSKLRDRFINASDRFILAQQLSAVQIAQVLKSLEIDIAVDLAGYTSDSRIDIFLHRPAPIQVNYLGYPGTMALDCYDYIIADRTTIPIEHKEFYSEEIAYLDGCYLPIASGIDPAVPLTRSDYGLPDDGFVFCAFSHDYKIHPKIFNIWMRLLERHPSSVFWLMSRNTAAQENLRDRAMAWGISPDRLVFAERLPRIEDHLARYRVANLFLDTWPYNAHTTAADALLVGLPVVTYKGDAFPSRVAASLLDSLGMHGLVTNTLDGYFDLASSLAGNPEQLQEFRDKLTSERLHSHLAFGEPVTRRLEVIYQSMQLAKSKAEDITDTVSKNANTPPDIAELIKIDIKLSKLKIPLDLYEKGNFPQAEIFLRDFLKNQPRNEQALDLLSKISSAYGIEKEIRLSEQIRPERTGERYLLIKSWGYGFWSDAHHVASQLLVAELTHRKPIIWWGSNSLYGDGSETDCFTRYFLPVGDAVLSHIPADASIYPSKWINTNLLKEDINKWFGDGSRLAAQYIFSRDENLVVSDFYSTLDSIIPWIDSESIYYGKNEQEIYSILFQKYFNVSNRLRKKIDDFYEKNMSQKNWVSVHVRGIGKRVEQIKLNENNSAIYPYVDLVIAKNPNIGIFLITDSTAILNEFKTRYGEALLTTNVRPSENENPIRKDRVGGWKIGDEIVINSFLAARCNFFLGNKESNFSLAIYDLINWIPGTSFLIGKSSIRAKNYYLHGN
jgi:protein O-GlcNAc transferase